MRCKTLASGDRG